jgi:hypothetical protein
MTEVLPIGPPPLVPVVVERLGNTSFEDELSVWKIDPGYSCNYDGVETGFFANNARTGSNSYQSSGISRQDGYGVRIYQHITIAPGEIYTFSGYIKQEVEGKCDVSVGFASNGNSDDLAYAYVAVLPVDYAYFTGTTNVRQSGTGRFSLNVFCQEGTKVYFDDLSFS